MSSSLISDSQKDFITSSIRNDFRIDGRSNAQPQKYQIKINNLDHLLGSSLVRIQTAQNEVHIYTGIKIRVEKLSAVKKDSNLQVKAKNIKDRVEI
jgi:exosome complex RNA-binding protein Rrp42 (RNase PH superfamily)